MFNPEIVSELNENSNFPTPEEWQAIQGGAPEVWVDDKRTIVKILYFGPGFKDSFRGAEVDTSAKETKYFEQTANLSVNGRQVEVPIYLLWDLHGRPCETRSIQAGGEPYQRFKPDKYDYRREQLGKRGFTQVDLNDLATYYAQHRHH